MVASPSKGTSWNPYKNTWRTAQEVPLCPEQDQLCLSHKWMCWISLDPCSTGGTLATLGSWPQCCHWNSSCTKLSDLSPPAWKLTLPIQQWGTLSAAVSDITEDVLLCPLLFWSLSVWSPSPLQSFVTSPRLSQDPVLLHSLPHLGGSFISYNQVKLQFHTSLTV